MASEQIGIVTRKGQVTIPAQIRRSLQINEGDQVAFVLENSEVRLIPRGSVTKRTAGMFRTRKKTLSAEELRTEAEAAMAADVENC